MSALQRRTFEANVGRRARVRDMNASLRTEFAQQLMARKFGDEATALILSAFGQVAKGKGQGDQRGHLHWIKCEAGGWTGKGVVRPGSQNYRVSFNGAPDIACIAARGDFKGDDDAYLQYVERTIPSLLPKAKARALAACKAVTP
jgi:hypothetical protein